MVQNKNKKIRDKISSFNFVKLLVSIWTNKKAIVALALKKKRRQGLEGIIDEFVVYATANCCVDNNSTSNLDVILHYKTDEPMGSVAPWAKQTVLI